MRKEGKHSDSSDGRTASQAPADRAGTFTGSGQNMQKM